MSDEKISKALGLPTLASLNVNDGSSDINGISENKEDDYEIIDDNEDSDDFETVEDNLPVEVLEGEIVEDEDGNYIESVDREKQKIEKEYIKDIDKAKTNITKLISESHLAFEELLLVATQTGNPAAFDAASKMLKNIVDANEKMVGMSEKKRSVKSLDNQNSINHTTTNNTLIVTTSELLKQFKKE